MIRGFASGILVGGLVSTLVLAAFSVVAPPLGGQPPKAAVPVAPSDAADAADAAPAPGQPVADAPSGAVTPVAPPPAPDALVTKDQAAPMAETGQTGPKSPAIVVPETTTPAPDASSAAPAKDDATRLAPGSDPAEAPAPAPTDSVAVAPAKPATAPVVQAETAPAVATAPAAKTAITALAPAPDETAPVAPKLAEAAPVVPATDALATLGPDLAPIVPALPAAPPRIETGTAPAPVAPPQVETSPPVVTEATPVPVAPPAAPARKDPLPDVLAEATLPQIDAPPAPPEQPKPRILTEDAPMVEAGTATLEPAPRLESDVDGVVTGRLPRIGGDTKPAADPAATTVTVEETPLVRFARDFENREQKPVFAIILIDTGEADLNRQSLAELPFPVSFALDPMDPDATAHAAIYRAAGQEVLMLATGIPEGATAADLEVSFAALSDRLPEAVAVLEQPDPVFQDDRPLATQIVPILAAQGRGLVTWDEGLNAADQVARREGLPSVMAFRNLDAEGESVETVRRYLDRAAFRAAQDGRVVVIGRTRSDTVEALIAWGLEGRSATVVLAPISAALSVN